MDCNPLMTLAFFKLLAERKRERKMIPYGGNISDSTPNKFKKEKKKKRKLEKLCRKKNR